jgi:hypothetical protein
MFGHFPLSMLSETQRVLDFIGGADADRTRDLLNAIQALSQLSYSPTVRGTFQLIG